MTDFNEEARKCKTLKDVHDLVKRMTKGLIEGMLEEELKHHLGYEKYDPKGKNTGNNRNGRTTKRVRSSVGDFELEAPRDRNSKFEPQLVRPYQTDISEFDQKIISMYAKGMTTRDIQEHVFEVYGAEISPTMVSLITDKVMVIAQEWQNRALAKTYAVVYFDAIHYKTREKNKIISRAAYTCIGIDIEGKKEILGIWVGENEGAAYWLSVFNELKSRGVQDILIACMDGLKGLPEALKAAFPQTEVQLCVIHLIRNSLKYVPAKHKAEFMQDLKEVYQAPAEQSAMHTLTILEQKWGTKYPLAVKPWINNWHNISGYFKYPQELRKLIYTTNIIESFHRQLRKVTKNRAILAHDESLFKILYLAARDVEKKWTKSVHNWSSIITQLMIIFPERATIA